ncbi:propionyl-synthetase [Plasmopara halstedii]|uniref:Propionyl-synthetase n=1 Tax=Plasmopara halstedii TaxID=4781 RepID=A0A0P1A5I6_PLAHL|nr:propionyl-synthetase [Plasmopara halstedii]CEG35832.1 propionyl-synthetase [Plasmopara halstedii]|eukprot:XP_024572201.1 propionyl-synthetase [Plasmopara halstedii]
MLRVLSLGQRFLVRRIQFSKYRAIASYAEQYRRSLDKPEEFWAEAAQDIEWFKPWSKVLDTTQGPSSRWFTGGEMNTCYNALDVHVNNGRGDVPALHYDSPLTSTKTSITYGQLLKEVSIFAGGLRKLGVNKGDRVVIYMPAVLETTVAMLACARLGAVHSVVFGGFAISELAARIDDATPKLIISGSCGVEPKGIIDYGPLLNGALERSTWKPSKVVMLQRDIYPFLMTKGRDVDWRDVMAIGDPVEAVPLLATDPLYILYTSGTTGRPKGVVRDNGGHAVALKWAMRNVFNITQEDTFFAASDMGWTVGHSLVVYGPLIHGCTSVQYAGKPVGTPDAGVYWRLITEYGIKSMFTAPTALRAIRMDDPQALLLKKKKREICKTLETMFVAGERGDPKTFKFFSDALGVPLIDHWWQTETGWPITAPCLGLHSDELTEDGHPRIKTGSVARPVPGWNVQLLKSDDASRDLSQNDGYEDRDAELVVKLPLPPGALTTLHNNSDDFYAKYFKRFPGYYHTGDIGQIDEDGFVYVMSRTDDVINVAGHRITTGSIEEVIIKILEVVECAVFGVNDPLKGQVPVALLVIDKEIKRPPEEIIEQVKRDVREQMGSFVCLKTVGLVNALPKTRSGKVMRATIQGVADSSLVRVPATIENVAVLDDIQGVLQGLGYAKGKPLKI